MECREREQRVEGSGVGEKKVWVGDEWRRAWLEMSGGFGLEMSGR